MSTLSLRLPNSLHRQLKEISGREGVSINQFVASAAGEKVAALLTADYLRERAALGKRSAFDAVLRRVRDVAPDAGDELPAKGKGLKSRGRRGVQEAKGSRVPGVDRIHKTRQGQNAGGGAGGKERGEA